MSDRTIRASEVEAGMVVEWGDENTISYRLNVTEVQGAIAVYNPNGSEMGYRLYAEGGYYVDIAASKRVTVLSQFQPDEPFEFGALVEVGDLQFVRVISGKTIDFSTRAWRHETQSGVEAWSWGQITEKGRVTVWSRVRSDAVSAPARILDWPEHDSHLREFEWEDHVKAVWSYRDGSWGYVDSFGHRWVSVRNEPFDGPWTRLKKEEK